MRVNLNPFNVSSKIFVADGIYFAISPTRDWNPRGIPLIFEMQVEICPCGFISLQRINTSGITTGTGLAASGMNGRGLYAGHDCRWSSRPQCPVECGLPVRDATTSEPVELAALACGCTGEELKTAVEISRQLAPQVWVDAAGPQECAKPTRNLGLPQLQLIKTGPPTPSQTQNILLRWSWWRDYDANIKCHHSQNMSIPKNWLYTICNTSNESIFHIHPKHVSQLI